MVFILDITFGFGFQYTAIAFVDRFKDDFICLYILKVKMLIISLSCKCINFSIHFKSLYNSDLFNVSKQYQITWTSLKATSWEYTNLLDSKALNQQTIKSRNPPEWWYLCRPHEDLAYGLVYIYIYRVWLHLNKYYDLVCLHAWLLGRVEYFPRPNTFNRQTGQLYEESH